MPRRTRICSVFDEADGCLGYANFLCNQEADMGYEKFEWNERYNIGVESIDREHRKLFNVMNKLR